ncbi:MAG: fluoride efflux transporter FluC [Micrococcales bacterium]
MPDISTILAIAAAGGLASVIRLALSRWHSRLPWGILLANIVASGLLGFWLHGDGMAKQVLIVGFCGGLSTFSSVVAASGEYIRAKETVKAVAYAVASLVLPLVALSLGVVVASGLLN